MARATKAVRKAPDVGLPGQVVGTINGFPIRRMLVSEIETATYNPREITERALEGLKNSLVEFGNVAPLVWNKRFLRLVAGHQRLKTLPADSYTDVVEVDLDLEREKALNVSLNSRAIQGDFTASVAEILDDLESKMPELYGRLALDDLRVEIPSLSVDVGEPDPDELPGNEQASETRTKTECPSCGHLF